jgi:hypothetical protein
MALEDGVYYHGQMPKCANKENRPACACFMWLRLR